MPDRTPTEVTNLDRYGSPALPWSRPRDLLEAGPPQPGVTFFLGTTRPDGRPHTAAVGALRRDGETAALEEGTGESGSESHAATLACRGPFRARPV